MTHTKKRIIWVLLGVIALIGCKYAISQHELKRAFEKTSVGEDKAVVVQRFGKPDLDIPGGQSVPVYSSAPCKTSCAGSLWWEAPFPVPKGIEAWVVDFDADGHVLNKAHILFP